jgi:putative endonuclease
LACALVRSATSTCFFAFAALAIALLQFVIPGRCAASNPESRDDEHYPMAFYVYILASRKDGAIYIGVTNDLVRRVYEHRQKAVPGFASKYNITRLVWFEIHDDPVFAITREKELKKWKRNLQIKLIETDNPEWLDLYDTICN